MTETRVDLTNCDREPIHILGAIQPFGFLLSVSSDWLVARASANLAAFTGVGAGDAIGRPASDILSQDAIHTLRNRLTIMRGEGAVERAFAVPLLSDGRLFDVALHLSGGQVVLEAEPSDSADTIDTGGMVRIMMSRLDQTDTLATFFREGARQVRALTGFDRVMVYRFDTKGAGEVVAEAVRPGLGSFLNLRYPASDIPAQARELYIRNLFRIIADVGAEPVPIVPVVDEHRRPLDLSLSVLRAVSPIHIEYLTNMGVGASLSISIVVEGKLWGLFACHHYSPRRPGFERRTVCELFGQMFAMKLESRQRGEIAAFEREGRIVAERISAAVAGDNSLMEDPAWLMEAIGRTIPSDGIGVSINGRQALAGLTPPAEALSPIVRALNATSAGVVFSTERIADLVAGAEDYADQAAGMLCIPISRSPRDYVILFRQEVIRSVRWAGDPNKPVEFGPNGPRLTPRKSFDAWSELVRGRSAPFTPAEVRLAESLRATLIEVVLRLADSASAERERFNERQELLIAELNHRVRNILNLIRGLVKQSRASATSIDDYVTQVEGRVQALARAHNQITEDHWGPVSLRTLLEAEAGAYLAGKADRVRTKGPDVLLDPQAISTVALVLHELVTNSAKYGGLSDSGSVRASWTLDKDGDLHIHWQERGGPPVQAPTREGFGTTIITRSIPYDLGGNAKVQYLLAGLEATFCIPARHVTLRTSAEPTALQQMPVHEADAKLQELPLAGRRVLLVEDSLIIALDAEDTLVRLGAEQVVPVATVRHALSEIARERPDLAVLDINLSDANSFPIADTLLGLGVPFLFASGYGEQAQLPGEHSGRPVVRKPFTPETLAAAITALPGSEA